MASAPLFEDAASPKNNGMVRLRFVRVYCTPCVHVRVIPETALLWVWGRVFNECTRFVYCMRWPFRIIELAVAEVVVCEIL